MSFVRSVLIALTTFTVSADTVTTRDSSSWNGKLTVGGGVAQLAATFPNSREPTLLRFGPAYIRNIEFNTTTFNPGAKPKLPVANGGKFPGTIYMRDKTNQRCADITVDSSGQVSCDGKTVKGVVRILM